MTQIETGQILRSRSNRRQMQSPRLARRSTVALAFALAVATIAGGARPVSAAGYVRFGQHGYGVTNVNPGVNRIGLVATINGQTSGVTQSVAYHVKIYDQNKAKWVDIYRNATGNSWSPCTVNSAVGNCRFTPTMAAPRGNYYISVSYAWFTTAGWETRSADLGWYAVY